MKYVFVDMDGTIAEWGYPDGRISGDFQDGDFLRKKPVDIIIEEIIHKWGNSDFCIIVCSAVPCTKATFEKNIWLDANFNVPYENRFFISKEEDKIDIIKYYIEKIKGLSFRQNAVIVDDRKDILQKAESYGVEFYHPTRLITDYMTRQVEEQIKAQEEAQKQQEEAQPEVVNGEPLEAQPTYDAVDIGSIGVSAEEVKE